MRTFQASLLFLVAIFFLGCNGDCVKGEGDPERRVLEIAAFEGLIVEGPVEVLIHRSDTQRVEIEAQPNIMDLMDKEVRNGVWSIRTTQCYKSGDGVIVHLSVPRLRKISIQGSGDVTSEDQLDGDQMDLEIAGSGDLSMIVNALTVNASITGTGDMEVIGMCQEFTGIIHGSGDIKAGDLQCATAKADVIGSGDINIHVTDALQANVTGSGNIRYKGDPPSVNKNVTGSGEITD